MAVLAELMVRLGLDSSDMEASANQSASNVEGSLNGIAGGAAGMLVGGAFAMALTSAMDISAARTSLQNQLGLTSAEAQQAGDLAGDVYAAGFGESMADVTAAVAGVSTSIGGLGVLTDKEMQFASKAALGLAKTFGVDVADSTGAVGQMIKTGLVKDATEGFDLVTTAMQSVPANLRDDVLPSLGEYSTQFRRVGLDGATSLGLISQAVKAGARDVDQVGDAIGQFGEIALAGGKPVEEAFKAIGLNAGEMAKLIGKGGASAEKALQMTMKGLNNTENAQVKLNAAGALFGDPGKVMGEALFALDPATAAAAAGLDKAGGSALAMLNNMNKDPAQQLTAAMRGFQQVLGEFLLPYLVKFGNFISENGDTIKQVIPYVAGLVAILAVWAAVQWIVNLAMMASPVTWIILGIIALIAIIVAVVLKWDWVKDQILQTWAFITGGLSIAWQWIKDTSEALWNWIMGKIEEFVDFVVMLFMNFTVPGLIMKHWDTIKNGAALAWQWVMDKIEGAVQGIKDRIAAIGMIVGMVTGFFGRVKDGVANKVGELIDFVRGIPDKVKNAVGDLGGLLVRAGRNIIQGLIDGVSGMIGSLQSKFSGITNMIPDWKGPMTVDLHLLEPSGGALMDGLMAGVDKKVPVLRAQLGGITAQIPKMTATGTKGSAFAGSSAQQMSVSFNPSGGDTFIEWLMETIRVNFGGDVSRLGEVQP